MWSLQEQIVRNLQSIIPDFPVLDRFLQNNRQSHLDQLFELLRIASISADSTKGAEMAQAADWVEAKLAVECLKTKQIHGDGRPLVYAESAPLPGKPAVLVYGDYDVQAFECR